MQNLKAFTLIELLVVISIIIFFSGLAFASYNNFGQDKKLEAESRKLVDALEQAKKKTAAGDRSLCNIVPPHPTITPIVDYFSVTFPSNSQYTLSPVCLFGNPTPIVYNNQNSVTFTNSPQTVQFTKLAGGSSGGCVKLQLGSSCRYVKIENTAVISEDKLLNCSNPCP